MRYRDWSSFAAGLTAALALGWLVFPRALYETRRQPLDFSHKVHGDKAGMQCNDCHALAADGRFSGVPKLAKCAECHTQAMGDTAAEKQLISGYVTTNREIPWLVYSRQPENVYFSHASHIKRGKLACEECHGPQGKSDHLRPYQQNRISGYSRDIWGPSISRISLGGRRTGMKMSDCEDCHRQRGRTDACMDCHK